MHEITVLEIVTFAMVKHSHFSHAFRIFLSFVFFLFFFFNYGSRMYMYEDFNDVAKVAGRHMVDMDRRPPILCFKHPICRYIL